MSSPAFPLEGTTPPISDRWICTFIAGAAITIGQALYLSTADSTVYPTTGQTYAFVGFALTNQPTVGAKVSVVCRGRCRYTAYGSVTRGTLLQAGPNGCLMASSGQPCSGGSGSIYGFESVGLAENSIASGGTGIVLLF